MNRDDLAGLGELQVRPIPSHVQRQGGLGLKCAHEPAPGVGTQCRLIYI
jgi:hypothetical protein